MEQLTRRFVALKAREAALVAERDNLEEPQFDIQHVELAQKFNAMGQIQEQVREFVARKARLISEEAILAQRLTALDQEMKGILAAGESSQTQLALLEKEVSGKAALLKKGLTARSEFNSLLRVKADLEGRVAGNEAAKGRVQSSQVEAREQLQRLYNQRRETASKGLNDLRVNLFAVREQLTSARDVLEKTTVRAPADGVIIGLKENSVGSVIPAGQLIATLVPNDATLAVEVRILPRDISRVKQGDKATIRLSSLNARTTPEVESEIIYISADSLSDRKTGDNYYLARIAMPAELPQGLDLKDLGPGMPVEAILGYDERTFLGYLFKPLTDSLSRAFRDN